MRISDLTIHRYISFYEKSGDALVGTCTVTEGEFLKIKTWLGYGQTELLYDCYPLKDETLKQVFELLPGRLIRGDYEYFPEAEHD